LQGKSRRIDYISYNQSCGTVGALSRKAKKHRNELAHFCAFLIFGTFAFLLSLSFSLVPLVLSFQGKNRKKNFIPDIPNRCQPPQIISA